MIRTRTATQTEELPEAQCLLCGNAAETYDDLCDRCAAAFQVLSDRVADAVIAARRPRLTVAGGCLCGHEEAHHDQELRDGPGEALEGEAPIICRHCLCEVFEPCED